MKGKPDISKKAFWDIRFEDLDFEKNKEYIIAKIFEYGKWEDMIAITRYYGENEIKAVLKKHLFFFPDTISFISTIFDIKKEEMACYTKKPYRPNVFS
ncbi:MAG: hypothetical protein JNL23_13305 [Chitinophagaceae bacterium]|nr:hypothetical protein [Chitinophagaceae bacterium]